MRKFRVLEQSLIALLVTLFLACTTPSKVEDAPAKAPSRVEGKGPAAPVAASWVSQNKASCLGPVEGGESSVLSLSNGKWERSGSTLTWLEGESDSILRLGVVSDIKEATPQNGVNAARFLGKFKDQKVDLILIAGDVSEEPKDIETAIGWFAAGGIPVGVIIGNREGVRAYEAAMGRLGKRFPNVVDLNRVRRIDTPNGDVISLPGYYDPNYLHAEDGCHYTESDLASLTTLKAACDSPVLLISHGGPRQSGPEAIDRTSEGANVGDPGLTTAIKELGIQFGVFGNVHEAGGRGTDIEGRKLSPAKAHQTLFLNPGPLDSVRWVMNDRSESTGMAAVFSIEGGRGTYEVLRQGAVN